MGKLSRDKGARGEREIVTLLREHGVSAERTAQMQTADGDARYGDVRAWGVADSIQIEVKRKARLPDWLYDDNAIYRTDPPGYLIDWTRTADIAVARADRRPWIWVVHVGTGVMILPQKRGIMAVQSRVNYGSAMVADQ